MNISKKNYIKALQSKSVINERRLIVLRAIYSSTSHKASPVVIAQKTGKNIHFVNLIFGLLAKSIARSLDIEKNTAKYDSDQWWPLIAKGTNEADGFNWQLRENFISALQELSLVNDDYDFPEQANVIALSYVDGGVKRITVNSFERNKKARAECVKVNGTLCKVCNIDFAKIYGSVGDGFIHVHHVIKISIKGRKQYRINPVTDLQPVCPNCHAMLHRGNKQLSIDDLKRMIKHRF